MRTHVSLALALAFGVLAAQPASAKECKVQAVIGTGVNESIAKFMAESGIKNEMSGRELTPSGPITIKCETGSFVTECSARQLGCK